MIVFLIEYNKRAFQEAVDAILHAQWSTGSGNRHSKWVDDPENKSVKIKVPQVQPTAISYTSGGSSHHHQSPSHSSSSSESSQVFCAAYTAVKSQPTYAALTTVLQHIRQRCPDFIPRTLLDFGSGPGSAVWAACDVWPAGKVETAHMVDLAEPMLHIAQRLAKARMVEVVEEEKKRRRMKWRQRQGCLISKLHTNGLSLQRLW